jgi:hypothetical protein
MISAAVRRISLAAVLIVPALAGCGASSTTDNAKDFSGAKKAVAQTIDDFSKATRDSDEKKICSSLLSHDLERRLDATRQRCTGAVSDQLDAAGDNKIDITGISVEGDQATATVKSKVDGHDRIQALLLVNESGTWRLDGVR